MDKAFLNGPYIRIRPATPDGSFDEILSLSYQNIRRRRRRRRPPMKQVSGQGGIAPLKIDFRAIFFPDHQNVSPNTLDNLEHKCLATVQCSAHGH